MADVVENPQPVSQEIVPMAKRKRVRQVKVAEGQEPPVKKATAVREYLAGHQEAKNKDVVAALAEKGVVVTPAYVSVVRSGKKVGKKKGRSGKSAPVNLKDALRQERVALLKRVDAINMLLE